MLVNWTKELCRTSSAAITAPADMAKAAQSAALLKALGERLEKEAPLRKQLIDEMKVGRGRNWR